MCTQPEFTSRWHVSNQSKWNLCAKQFLKHTDALVYFALYFYGCYDAMVL